MFYRQDINNIDQKQTKNKLGKLDIVRRLIVEHLFYFFAFCRNFAP